MRMKVYAFYMIVKKSKSGSIAAVSVPFLLGIFVFINIITALNIVLGSNRVNHLVNEKKIFFILIFFGLVAILEGVCFIFYPIRKLKEIEMSNVEIRRNLSVLGVYFFCTAAFGIISSIYL